MTVGSAPPILVVALGGHALQDPQGDDTVEGDFARTARTAQKLASFVRHGKWRLVVSHGNGPQVGNHLLRSELGHEHGELPLLPLDVCVADTQGGMGYMLQQSLTNSLHVAGLPGVVTSLVTQVVVAADDPAFRSPSKPVGEMICEDRVQTYRERGWHVSEDKRRNGWRRVVASPQPREIVEASAIKALVDDGVIVIASGGGGIPVIQGDDGALSGVDAVVDKDLSTALLAVDLDAHAFVTLTDVDRVFLDYGSPQERAVNELSVSEARRYLDEGQFPPGSMGPKVEATCRFAEATRRPAVIASVEKAAAALEAKAGTRITP